MRYRVFWPCAGSASFCASQVLAQGRVQPDSAQRLQAFLQAARQNSQRAGAELRPFPVIALRQRAGSGRTRVVVQVHGQVRFRQDAIEVVEN